TLAWPAAARSDLAPAPLFYLLAMMLIVAVALPPVWVAFTYVARRKGWADPNPGRAGFASSASLTTLSTAAPRNDRLKPSYDLWLGLEHGTLGGLRPLRGRGDRQTAGVVGPPGSGKTLGLILPGLLNWAGAAVATSTKTD